jgi:hypothetical protein
VNSETLGSGAVEHPDWIETVWPMEPLDGGSLNGLENLESHEGCERRSKRRGEPKKLRRCANLLVRLPSAGVSLNLLGSQKVCRCLERAKKQKQTAVCVFRLIQGQEQR